MTRGSDAALVGTQRTVPGLHYAGASIMRSMYVDMSRNFRFFFREIGKVVFLWFYAAEMWASHCSPLTSWLH